MSLMEILGNYYDSNECKEGTSDKTYSYDLRLVRKLKRAGMYQAEFATVFLDSNGKEVAELSSSYYAFNNALDKIHKNGSELACSAIRAVFRNNTKEFTVTKTSFETTKELELLAGSEACKALVAHETVLADVKIDITVEVDKLRQKAASDRGGKSPKDYFAMVCSAANKGEVDGGRGWRSSGTFGHNSIKGNVARLESEAIAFAIEYLYGTKVSKSATRKEKLTVLAKIPYTDFGLQDVQDIKQVSECFDYRHNSVKALYEKLTRTKVKPKTDLARWIKSGHIKLTEEV